MFHLCSFVSVDVGLARFVHLVSCHALDVLYTGVMHAGVRVTMGHEQLALQKALFEARLGVWRRALGRDVCIVGFAYIYIIYCLF